MLDPRQVVLRVVRLSGSLSLPLDDLHRNWEASLSNLVYRVQPTIEAKSKVFTKVMTPLGIAPTTRLKARRNWCTVVTWAIQNKALDKILPMEVLLWEFTSLGAAVITNGSAQVHNNCCSSASYLLSWSLSLQVVPAQTVSTYIPPAAFHAAGAEPALGHPGSGRTGQDAVLLLTGLCKHIQLD